MFLPNDRKLLFVLALHELMLVGIAYRTLWKPLQLPGLSLCVRVSYYRKMNLKMLTNSAYLHGKRQPFSEIMPC
jgi:hypothetical protein